MTPSGVLPPQKSAASVQIDLRKGHRWSPQRPYGHAEQNTSFQSSKTSLTREHFNSALWSSETRSCGTSPTLSNISLLNLARKLCSHLATHIENTLAKGQKLTITDNLDISLGMWFLQLPSLWEELGKAGEMGEKGLCLISKVCLPYEDNQK